MKSTYVTIIALVVLVLIYLQVPTTYNIALVMWQTKQNKEEYEQNKKYCEERGITLYYSENVCAPGRHPSWQKMCWLRNLVKTKHHTHFIVTEGLLPVDTEKKIKPGYDLMMSKDETVIIVKNTEYSKKFLNETLDEIESRCSDPLFSYEKSCINEYRLHDFMNINSHLLIFS